MLCLSDEDHISPVSPAKVFYFDDNAIIVSYVSYFRPSGYDWGDAYAYVVIREAVSPAVNLSTRYQIFLDASAHHRWCRPGVLAKAEPELMS